jgi:hypothetical protein
MIREELVNTIIRRHTDFRRQKATPEFSVAHNGTRFARKPWASVEPSA